MSLITKRLGKTAAVAFGEGIRSSPRIRIEEVTPQVLEQAWKLIADHRDKDYDLIDCISYAAMESLHIRDVFGLDHHFTQYGFHLLQGRQRPAPDRRTECLPPDGDADP